MLDNGTPMIAPSAPRGQTTLLLLVLAATLTLLNAVKPLHIDDPFIYEVARQIVADPTDPYGFDIFWLQWPQPVYEELTPPVTPYWWALGLALFGPTPWLWKLWFFPFAFLLVRAVDSLVRRLAPGMAPWATIGLVLSPAFLPGFNLMQDVPAIALGLTALTLWFRSVDEGSPRLAVLSGLVAGLATQTKYTMVGILAAIALHALLERRRSAGAIAIGTALAIFAAWEALMTLRYGQGMFLGQLRYGLFWLPRSEMILPMIRLTGATLPLAFLPGLLGLGLPSRWALPLGGAIVAAYGTLFLAPTAPALFGILGVIWWAALAASALRLVQTATSSRGEPAEGRLDLFLVLWFVVELGVFLSTAPFPAVRRVMGLLIVATFLFGRLAARTDRLPGPRTLQGLAAAGVVLALLFQSVDILEARAQQQAPRLAAEAIRQRDPQARIWYVGHWGFQFHAEQLGMLPIVPDRSRLAPGDWVVVPDRVHKQEVRFPIGALDPLEPVRAGDGVPLSTGHGYYGGSIALSHLDGPRLTTEVFQVRQGHVPVSAWGATQLADWAVRAGGSDRRGCGTGAGADPAAVGTGEQTPRRSGAGLPRRSRSNRRPGPRGSARPAGDARRAAGAPPGAGLPERTPRAPREPPTSRGAAQACRRRRRPEAHGADHGDVRAAAPPRPAGGIVR